VSVSPGAPLAWDGSAWALVDTAGPATAAAAGGGDPLDLRIPERSEIRISVDLPNAVAHLEIFLPTDTVNAARVFTMALRGPFEGASEVYPAVALRYRGDVLALVD
jgi:hypothetical protein